MRFRRQRIALAAAALCVLLWYMLAGSRETALPRTLFTESNPRAKAEPWWTAEKLRRMPLKLAYNSPRPYKFAALAERLRFEEHQVWRPPPPARGVGSHTFPRPHTPSKQDYTDFGGSYLTQTILGDFSPWSSRIFLLFKTGAETQWHRSLPHFMTTFTKFVHFALYSDHRGRMLGHPVVDVLANLPDAVHLKHNDTVRYRALEQMRREHWNWAPERLDSPGGWQLDKYKNLPALYDAWKRNTSCDWFVLMDDDAYILQDNLAAYLAGLDAKQMIYTGNPGNTYLSRDWVPFAHGGSLIVCSRPVLSALFAGDAETLIQKWALKSIEHCCGDALLAETLRTEIGVEMTLPDYRSHALVGLGGPFQANNLQGLVQHKDHMCNPIISFHHLQPHDVEVLYEYERMWDQARPITYNDIYRDFMLPYIVEERPNWVLTSDHLTTYFRQSQFSEKNTHMTAGGQDWYPAASKESCRDSCIANPECAAWSFKLGECKHSDVGLSLGTAANHWNRNRAWTTGYLVDRIREWRRESECDPLQQDAEGNWNDNDDTSEGWFVRKMGALKETERFTNRDRDSTIPGLALLNKGVGELGPQLPGQDQGQDSPRKEGSQSLKAASPAQSRSLHPPSS